MDTSICDAGWLVGFIRRLDHFHTLGSRVWYGIGLSYPTILTMSDCVRAGMELELCVPVFRILNRFPVSLPKALPSHSKILFENLDKRLKVLFEREVLLASFKMLAHRKV